MDGVQKLDFRFDEDRPCKAELTVAERDGHSVAVANDKPSGGVDDESDAGKERAGDTCDEEGYVKTDSTERGVDERGDLGSTAELEGKGRWK